MLAYGQLVKEIIYLAIEKTNGLRSWNQGGNRDTAHVWKMQLWSEYRREKNAGVDSKWQISKLFGEKNGLLYSKLCFEAQMWPKSVQGLLKTVNHLQQTTSLQDWTWEGSGFVWSPQFIFLAIHGETPWCQLETHKHENKGLLLIHDSFNLTGATLTIHQKKWGYTEFSWAFKPRHWVLVLLALYQPTQKMWMWRKMWLKLVAILWISSWAFGHESFHVEQTMLSSLNVGLK